MRAEPYGDITRVMLLVLFSGLLLAVIALDNVLRPILIRRGVRRPLLLIIAGVADTSGVPIPNVARPV